ncbi:MAG: molybdenum cofactor guanylyltransferase [Planctomycetota bacterium]|nr:molybdenum cofactor guanylyltransferase [Planctomycetota bacterium]
MSPHVQRAAAATLAILAGGEGRRMGGPKGELRIEGKPILGYLLDRFRWDGPTLLVTAPGRERPAGCERFGREVTDPVAGEGPLRGVLTALAAVETEMLVVTTCDMPRVGARQLAWLTDELSRRPDAPLVMLSRDSQLEPFPLGIRSSAIAIVTTHYARGARGMRSLATLEGAAVITAPDDWPAEAWTNLNTPADLAAFEDGAGSG